MADDEDPPIRLGAVGVGLIGGALVFAYAYLAWADVVPPRAAALFALFLGAGVLFALADAVHTASLHVGGNR